MNIILLIVLVIILLIIFGAAQNESNNKTSERREEAYSQSERPQSRAERSSTPGPISSSVKGTSYRSIEEIGAARFCDIGDTLILVPEPNNQYDPNAVKIYTMEGFHIGYVDAKYSELVSSHINNIDQCIITHVTKHEVPYIDYNIKFSSTTVTQPKFIPKEFQCSPEDRMKNLSSNINKAYDYRRVPLMVKGLYELDRATIAKARKARKGDKITLKKGECDEYNPYRLDVFLEDGTFVGYGDNLYSGEIYALFDHIVASFVDSPISRETANRLAVSVFFPEKLECPAQFLQSSSISVHYSGSYPEVKIAQELRRDNPLAALDLLLPIVKREKGIDARMECIACYYHLKDWESRIDIINETIRHIDSLTEEDLPKDELLTLQRYIPSLVKQLEYSQKRMEAIAKKRK